MAAENLVLQDKVTRNIAIVIIVLVGIAYMGWLVVTYMEQRETGQYIRATMERWAESFTAEPAKPQTVEAEVVPE